MAPKNLNKALLDDESYNQGRAASRDGKRSDANPYPRSTVPYQRWRDGWIDEELKDF